jgi:hypothetical protein
MRKPEHVATFCLSSKILFLHRNAFLFDNSNATDSWNVVLHSGVDKCRDKFYSHRFEDLKSHMSVDDCGLLIRDDV